MADAPVELNHLQTLLLNISIALTAAQLDEIDDLIKSKFGDVDAEEHRRITLALVQTVATNYLALATTRNVPRAV